MIAKRSFGSSPEWPFLFINHVSLFLLFSSKEAAKAFLLRLLSLLGNSTFRLFTLGMCLAVMTGIIHIILMIIPHLQYA